MGTRAGRPASGGPDELPPAVRAALQRGADRPVGERAARGAGRRGRGRRVRAGAGGGRRRAARETALEAIASWSPATSYAPPPPGRFRFRHPLVRHAAYGSAAAGWRLAAHARIAAHLADLGAPADRARPPRRALRRGSATAPPIATLVAAARAVAAQAPTTAAHWLRCRARSSMPERAGRPTASELLAGAGPAAGRQRPAGRGPRDRAGGCCGCCRRRLRTARPGRTVRRADGTPARPAARGPGAAARRAAPHPRPAVGRRPCRCGSGWSPRA